MQRDSGPFPESQPYSPNVFLPHLLRLPHPRRHFFSRLRRQIRIFSTLILDLCVLLPGRQLASPPLRSVFFFFFSTHRVGEGGYLHCFTAEAPPSSPSPAPKWTEVSEEDVWRKGAWVLGGVRLPHPPPVGRSLLLSHIPTAISIYTATAFPPPRPHPQPFSFPCPFLLAHSSVPEAETKALALT